MALPQDIAPVNSELMDTIARSGDMDWIETKPGMAYMKVLTAHIGMVLGDAKHFFFEAAHANHAFK